MHISSKQAFNLLWASVLVGLLVLAAANRFIQDDAYISFRYAQNFAAGHGLVWNVGEPPVEGYTNFLWTLLMAVPHALGWNPVHFAWGVGLACFAGTLLATYALARQIFGRRDLALLVMLILGTNYTFSSYATGGLETPLQALLFTLSLLVLLRLAQRQPGQAGLQRGLAALSVLLALGVLTHPDSALVGVIAAPAAAWISLRRPGSGWDKARRLLALIGPAAVIGGVWAFWKLTYYGNLLPNTFYAKMGADIPWARGAHYIALFLFEYMLLPLAVLIPLALRRLDAQRWLLLGLVALWLGYLLVIGGDFMEYRMMVPILPVLAIQIVGMLFEVLPAGRARRVLLSLVLIGPAFYLLTFKWMPRFGIETTMELAAHLDEPAQNWDGVGRALHAAFGDAEGVTIATTAAGAIPYYSRLRTVDIYGLSDSWVAHHGEYNGAKAGHLKRAPLAYLITQDVDLLIGHPILDAPTLDLLQLYPPTYLLKQLYLNDADLPATAQIICIPVEDGYSVLAVYLAPDPVVDAVIAREGWPVAPVDVYREPWEAALTAG